MAANDIIGRGFVGVAGAFISASADQTASQQFVKFPPPEYIKFIPLTDKEQSPPDNLDDNGDVCYIPFGLQG